MLLSNLMLETVTWQSSECVHLQEQIWCAIDFQSTIDLPADAVAPDKGLDLQSGYIMHSKSSH